MNFLYSPSSKGLVMSYLDLNGKSDTWSLSLLFNNIIKINGDPSNGHLGEHLLSNQIFTEGTERGVGDSEVRKTPSLTLVS